MGKRIELDMKLIEEYHAKGMGCDSIAALMGVNKKTILRRFKELNLYPNFKLGSHKKCCCCNELLPIGDFHWANKKRNAKYYCCKECSKEISKNKKLKKQAKHTEEYYDNISIAITCNHCNETLDSTEFYRCANTTTGFKHKCKLCFDKDIKKNHKAFFNLNQKRARANQEGIKFAINAEDLQYPETCPILGIVLNYETGKVGAPDCASLDKIIPSLGYVPGNVIIMSRLANTMKNCASLEQLKLFSQNILKLVNKIETDGALGDITDLYPDIKLKDV